MPAPLPPVAVRTRGVAPERESRASHGAGVRRGPSAAPPSRLRPTGPRHCAFYWGFTPLGLSGAVSPLSTSPRLWRSTLPACVRSLAILSTARRGLSSLSERRISPFYVGARRRAVHQRCACAGGRQDVDPECGRCAGMRTSRTRAPVRLSFLYCQPLVVCPRRRWPPEGSGAARAADDGACVPDVFSRTDRAPARLSVRVFTSEHPALS